jgi:myo-inositol-1(or 4)-monophosphatase
LRNGIPVKVTASNRLEDVLFACGIDDPLEPDKKRSQLAAVGRLLEAVRNVRTTNSLVDVAFTSDGRLGGLLNWNTRIWDIAAPMLIIQEAGGIYGQISGAPIELDISEFAPLAEYAVLATAHGLFSQTVAIVNAIAE